MTPQESAIIAVVAIAAASALAYGIWWLWWRLPKRQIDRLALKIRDPKARADVEDDLRKTVGQALGGAAVLIGAGSALFQFLQQQQTAQIQFLHQQRAAHDLLISNQVSKGFEQLAGKEPAMRLGGVYALEGVMNTSEQYRVPLLEALCAFVRDNTIGMIVKEKPGENLKLATDVAPYHDRQIVILERDSWADWLDPSIPAQSLIKPLSAGSLAVEQVG
jgi:hypothetical protein